MFLIKFKKALSSINTHYSLDYGQKFQKLFDISVVLFFHYLNSVSRLDFGISVLAMPFNCVNCMP